MENPEISRPYMPGYGIAGRTQGSGLLPWSWAAERLTSARNYWVIVGLAGRPAALHAGLGHVGRQRAVVHLRGALAQGRNLRAEPRCVVTTEDASDPVIIEGTAPDRDR